MAKTILIYSTQREFLDQLETCLEAESDFIIVPVQSADQALNAVTNRKFDAVILDAADDGLSTEKFTNDLIDQHPGTRILLYPPENDAFHPEVRESLAHKVLAKPFSPEVLIDSLNDLFMEQPEDKPAPQIPSNEVDMLFFEETDPAEIEELQLPGDDVKNPDELSIDPVEETGSEAIPDSPQPEETTSLEDLQTIETIEASGESTDILVTPPPLDLQPITPDESVSVPFSEEMSTTPENDELVVEKSAVEASIPEKDAGPAVTGTEPMNLAGIRLDYNAVLIPRHDQQYLARDLADHLSVILPQMHQGLGWRVNGISIRPHYLSWNFSIPATVTPLEAIEQIRQLTSTQLYTSFPELQNVDTDQDFWAPGYLVMSGVRFISPGIIKEFIDRTRNPK